MADRAPWTLQVEPVAYDAERFVVRLMEHDVTLMVHVVTSPALGRLHALVSAVNEAGRLREALEAIADGCPPDDWEDRDRFGDYAGYDGILGDVDPSNNGDVHAHGWWCGRHSAAVIARAALSEGDESHE